jgi:2-dehydropantoate 2-reductase
MKIAIVGAGAMGSLFGALLARGGNDVRLIDVWKAHVAAINADGLSVERDGSVSTVRLHAATDSAGIGTADLVIVFVKSTDTGAAARTAEKLAGDNGYVLTLQNGMGNADVIAGVVTPERVIAGTTSHGATLLGPGRIRHAGVGSTVIGMWHGRDVAVARRIADYFSDAGIETRAVEDVRAIVWGKLLINVGINAITALTGIKNGQLLDLDDTRELAAAAVREAMAVARAENVTICEDAVEHVFEVAGATAANRSSMGQDVDKRRRTEIESINGVIVKKAEQLGLQAPVNKALTALVRTLQAHYGASQ